MKKNKNIARIALLTSVAIFSLMATTVGTYAWFLSTRSYETNVSHFSVSRLEATIYKVYLYKFDYASDGLGGLDYLDPARGAVHRYEYKTVEVSAGVSETGFWRQEDGDWISTDIMNLYDPLNGFITGRGLLGLNCNVVFEVVLNSSSLTNISVNVSAKEIEASKTDDEQIFLSECADFDVFIPEDLNDSSLMTGAVKNYLPNESTDYLPQNTVFDNEYEENYYKFSYLAAQKAEDAHAHLYGVTGDPRTVLIDSPVITFTNTYASLYVNMNYAPSRLKQYEETVTPEHTIQAIYDFLFDIS